jgi:hypothetical protein
MSDLCNTDGSPVEDAPARNLQQELASGDSVTEVSTMLRNTYREFVF